MLNFKPLYLRKVVFIMQVISVINKKGGVAKTTTALALAAGLSKVGLTVLAIDCDAQANFSKASGGEENVVGTFDILTKNENINDTIQGLPLYDLIGADKRLTSIDIALNKPGREYNLKKALLALDKHYDYCIIDNPPALNVAVANSLAVSDKVIICSCAEAFSVDGIMEISAVIDDIREFVNPALKIDGILITLFNPRTIIGQHQREQLLLIAEAMKTRVYNTVIRRCNTISVSQSERRSIFDYPKSNAAIDYYNFLEEFLNG